MPRPDEKKGEGVTVDISSFGSNNRVFVDEGHKGHSTEDQKWKKVRKELTKNGFTIEYSATFGQAIESSKEEDFVEYSKAILFDYSYKYFFNDGYGKDFRILNLDSSKFNEELIDVLLLANMISFFEQKDLFNSFRDTYSQYNISVPLWIFIGHKVQEDTSDLLRLIQFFSRLLKNKNNWASLAIDRIIKGKSGLADKSGRDVFARRLPEKNLQWIRERKYSASHILNGIFREVYNVTDSSNLRKLRLIDIKNAAGEIALRLGDSEIFAIINIGNKSEFLKLIKETEDVILDEDRFGSSIFSRIEEENSRINILIGAKKFIEGWNSWRVSSMGLLNIGRKEGAQIIQLFGRGVRLKGKGLSLKRSRFLNPPHPKFIELMETLNIFGIRASYLDIFRSAIEKEEALYHEIVVPTQIMSPFPPNLQILKLQKSLSEFKNERPLLLESLENLLVRVDLRSKIELIDSRRERAMYEIDSKEYGNNFIDKSILDQLDWDEIYMAILRFKKEKNWSNILIKKDTLSFIISNNRYQLICDEKQIRPTFFTELKRIQDIVITVLKKYLEYYYINERKKWQYDNTALQKLDPDDSAINKEYIVKVKESESHIINEIQSMHKTGKIYDTNTSSFIRNILFDRHLFQPLLATNNDGILINPQGLNDGEILLMEDLRDYWVTHLRQANEKIFLLRNLVRGSGIGFYDFDSFYPDFILWRQKGQTQTISFVEPKGLIFVDLNDPKLHLHEFLRGEGGMNIKDPNVCLNAFTVSTTPYDLWRRRYSYKAKYTLEELERLHILFQFKREGVKNTNYVEKLFEIIDKEIFNST